MCEIACQMLPSYFTDEIARVWAEAYAKKSSLLNYFIKKKKSIKVPQ